ncbi:MAG: SDR family NAD(P)-dependent oxidoreductase [Gammaproteobacteria bacterium]|jgi:NAD(P)-dependent dehydrogenase (short-subunit alcohol dehydrogenase family)|nr:SDR family NAD(P)-dependent oxidoreductase [Gammaproteobacteria bacterium]
MTQDVCLISGVGPGTGTALARRFAEGGYRIAMIARDTQRLSALEQEISGAKAYPCDVSDEAAVKGAVEAVRGELGAPSILIHNAVRGTFGSFMEIDPADLKRNFDINTMGFLYLARACAPAMLEAGSGAIIASGNTSALRGKPNFSAFAPTKAAQRVLAESMARTLGPQGIHVAYIVIDAVIDLAWTREMLPDAADDYFIQPTAIAETAYQVAHQDRSAWSFNVELRPFGEEW